MCCGNGGSGLLYSGGIDQNKDFKKDMDAVYKSSNGQPFLSGKKRSYDFSGKSSANSFSSKYGSKFNNYSVPNPEEFSKSLETSVSI